jgi:excisionase family DNA binding protein
MRIRKPSGLLFEQCGGASKQETATYLNLGVGTVDKLIKEGKLKARKVGKRVIVLTASARDFLHGEAAA